MKTALWIIVIGGIIFSMPSTMYIAVFKGIFGRVRLKMRDLKAWCRGDEALISAYEKALDAFSRLQFQDVFLTADDGKRLHGAYLGRKSDRLVIFAHGYRTQPEINFAIQIQDFLGKGYDILLVDHRAHGKSEGLFSSMGYLEGMDLLMWVSWAPYEKVVVYGMSMGCAAAGYASDKMDPNKVRAIIMDCGFSNFFDELNYKCDLWKMPKAGFAPAEALLAKLVLGTDLKINTASSLAKCRIPVFFLHGDNDNEVPIGEMHRQYAACASQKKCLVVKGAHHALAYGLGGEAVRDEVMAFTDLFIDDGSDT